MLVRAIRRVQSRGEGARDVTCQGPTGLGAARARAPHGIGTALEVEGVVRKIALTRFLALTFRLLVQAVTRARVLLLREAGPR